jgi:multidrug efflux pump subunit AcrA (membrane-fusion protein)
VKVLINIILSAALIGGGVFFYKFIGGKEVKKRPSVKRKAGVQVSLKKPVKEIFPVTLDLWGEVKYSRVVDVRAEVEGRVISVAENFRPGYKVSENQKIVRVDSERLIKRKAEIQANVLKTKADLAQMSVEEQTLKAELDLAYENVKLAESDVDRHKELVRKKSISPVTLNSFNQILIRQKTAWQQLKSRLELIPQKKLAISAGIKALNSSLELLERDIKDTEITAPFSGVLMEPVISSGDYLRKGDVVCRIYDPGNVEIWVPIGVSEKEKLGEIRNITVEGKKITEYRYLGSADKDLQSDTLIFNLSGSKLKAGELVICRFQGQTLEDVYSFPVTALRDDRESVYKIVDGKLKIQKVVVALRDKSNIYISSGISSDDSVVTNRLRDIAEGTPAHSYVKEELKPGEAAKVELKQESDK